MRASATRVNLRVPFAAVLGLRRTSRLRDWLKERGTQGERIDDARVVVSELVANSVRHAQPLADGTCWSPGASTSADSQISVTDGGSPTYAAHRRRPAVRDVGPRACRSSRRSSSDWWAEHDPRRAHDRARRVTCPPRLSRTQHLPVAFARMGKKSRVKGSATHATARPGEVGPAPAVPVRLGAPLQGLPRQRRRCPRRSSSAARSRASPASATSSRCASSCPPRPRRSRLHDGVDRRPRGAAVLAAADGRARAGPRGRHDLARAPGAARRSATRAATSPPCSAEALEAEPGAMVGLTEAPGRGTPAAGPPRRTSRSRSPCTTASTSGSPTSTTPDGQRRGRPGPGERRRSPRRCG